MKTRCKMRCQWLNEDDNGTTWNFGVVSHDDNPEHENAQFNKYSPMGSFQITVDKKHYKGEHPVQGKEYYFDISEAPVE